MEKYALCGFIRGFRLTSENDIFTPKKYRISIRVFKVETTKRCISQNSVRCLRDDSSWAPCS